MIINNLRKLSNQIFSLFYPNLCAGCHVDLVRHEKIICLSCWETLPKTNFHLREKNPVAQKFWGKINIQHATSFYYFNKEGRLQQILHALKYRKQFDVGILLGQKMGVDLLYADWIKNIDLIIPIPLSKEKMRIRGYNQSESIALGISAVLNIPVQTNNIIRVKNTASQTNKNIAERMENVKDAFAVQDAEKLKNKHVLLIDDVLTTGATLEACARELLTIENCKISKATIAYAMD
jgi:ComF family protein